MARHDPDRDHITAALELLTENGFEGMATAIELLLNEAMKLERSAFLGAVPRHALAEHDGRHGDRRTTRLRPGLASPVVPEAVAMSADDGVGLQEDDGVLPVPQASPEHHPEDAVAVLDAWALDRSPETIVSNFP